MKCVSSDLNQGKTPLLVIAYAGEDQCNVQFYLWGDRKYICSVALNMHVDVVCIEWMVE